MSQPTHIAAGTRIEGEILNAIAVEIAGELDGAVVASERVHVLRTGSVRGPVLAPDITIEGNLVGAASATRSIAVTATARIVGDLRAPDISVEPGAEVDGKVEPVAHRPTPLSPTRVPAQPRGGLLVRPRLIDVGEASPPRSPPSKVVPT